MKKSFTVDVTTKSGRIYSYEDVTYINYAFNHGKMINLTIFENNETFYKVFPKYEVENISIKPNYTCDGGNDLPIEHNEDENDMEKSTNESEQTM